MTMNTTTTESTTCPHCGGIGLAGPFHTPWCESKIRMLRKAASFNAKVKPAIRDCNLAARQEFAAEHGHPAR
jgi:DnaJ-class molecular chaperone